MKLFRILLFGFSILVLGATSVIAGLAEDIGVSQQELEPLCERIGDLAFYVADKRVNGENVDELSDTLTVKILSDASEGKIHKAVAVKMVTAIALGSEGKGHPIDIGRLVYRNCMGL